MKSSDFPGYYFVQNLYICKSKSPTEPVCIIFISVDIQCPSSFFFLRSCSDSLVQYFLFLSLWLDKLFYKRFYNYCSGGGYPLVDTRFMAMTLFAFAGCPRFDELSNSKRIIMVSHNMTSSCSLKAAGLTSIAKVMEFQLLRLAPICVCGAVFCSSFHNQSFHCCFS